MLTTVEAADTYFSTRLNSQPWAAANSDTKTAALATAENDLDLFYTLVGSNAKHLKAIYEQALFRLTDPAVDRRTALKAQGVQAAGVVSETYTGTGGSVAICGYARQALGSPGDPTGSGELTRDDEV